MQSGMVAKNAKKSKATTKEVDKHLVRGMAAVGCRHSDIAKRLGITTEDLRKNFRKELETAAIEANAKVLEALFEMAISGKNTTAAIFWAKTRCGLRDKTGPRGALKQVPPALVVRAEL